SPGRERGHRPPAPALPPARRHVGVLRGQLLRDRGAQRRDEGVRHQGPGRPRSGRTLAAHRGDREPDRLRGEEAMSTQPRKERKTLYNLPAHLNRARIASHLDEPLLLKYNTRSATVRKGDTVRVLRGE